MCNLYKILIPCQVFPPLQLRSGSKGPRQQGWQERQGAEPHPIEINAKETLLRMVDQEIRAMGTVINYPNQTVVKK